MQLNTCRHFFMTVLYDVGGKYGPYSRLPEWTFFRRAIAFAKWGGD